MRIIITSLDVIKALEKNDEFIRSIEYDPSCNMIIEPSPKVEIEDFFTERNRQERRHGRFWENPNFKGFRKK